MKVKKSEVKDISTCQFQREQSGKWESGLLLNEGDKGILDLNGNIPDEVWTYIECCIPKYHFTKLARLYSEMNYN